MTGLLMEQVAALGRNPARFQWGLPAHAAPVMEATKRDHATMLSNDLRKAARFVLTDEVVRLAVEFGEGDPARVAAALTLVRAPAEYAWFEWDEHARQRASYAASDWPVSDLELADVAPRAGLLLTPSIREGTTTAQPVWPGPGGVIVCPAGFNVGFGNPDLALDNATSPNPPAYVKNIKGTQPGDLDRKMEVAATVLLGPIYMARYEAQADDLQRLAGYAIPTITKYGGAWISIARRGSDPTVTEFADRALATLYGDIAGDYRFLMSVLAVMQAAGDAVEVTAGERKRGGASERSVIRTPVSHSIIRLRVGADIVRRRLEDHLRVARESPRWHAFRATRCYSRKHGDPKCEHAWFQPDAARDFHVCSRCDMRSWSRAGGWKGDKARGTVEKTYMVTAGGRA